jgi:hypothetical protein
MDAAWIQVFVLTLSECVAPAGKTVCQEQEFEMQFLSQAECQVALEQLIALKDRFDNVIVNRQKSGCARSVRQSEVFASLEDAKKALGGADDWQDPDAASATAARAEPHEDRIEKLASCEESLGITPCRMGDVIVEGAATGAKVEVWRSAD